MMRWCTKTDKYEVLTTPNQGPDPRASQLLISEKAAFCKKEENFEYKENFCQEWQEVRGELNSDDNFVEKQDHQ